MESDLTPRGLVALRYLATQPEPIPAADLAEPLKDAGVPLRYSYQKKGMGNAAARVLIPLRRKGLVEAVDWGWSAKWQITPLGRERAKEND